jgi:flagellar biosynthesis protein FliQ
VSGLVTVRAMSRIEWPVACHVWVGMLAYACDFMELSPTLLEPGRDFLARLVALLPNLAVALLILLLGWVLAKFTRLVIFRFLLAVRFDIASERAGIDDVLVRADIRQGPAELLATLVYWLILLVVLMTAVHTVGLSALSDVLNQVLRYIPKVIAAVVVLILGLFFASFLAGAVKAAAANAGLAESDALAHLTRYAIVAFTIAVTLEELGIAPALVRSAFVILFGAVALALALAFGLGCKDLAREWVVRYLDSARSRKKSH